MSHYAAHNPMFKAGEEELKPYMQEAAGFDKAAYQILLLNNSDLGGAQTFGVLHKAEMLQKDPTQARVVNSMMLCLNPSDKLTKEEERNPACQAGLPGRQGSAPTRGRETFAA